MRILNKKTTLIILGLFLMFYAFVTSIYNNVSKSEPVGYYFAYPWYQYKVNDLVLVCINDKKYLQVLRRLNLPYVSDECENKVPYLLKRIVAVGGDSVKIIDAGVEINNKLYPNSKGILKHKDVNLLPQAFNMIKLKKNQFFLLGETPTSYDSRYFGVVTESQIYKKVLFLKGAHT